VFPFIIAFLNALSTAKLRLEGVPVEGVTFFGRECEEVGVLSNAPGKRPSGFMIWAAGSNQSKLTGT